MNSSIHALRFARFDAGLRPLLECGMDKRRNTLQTVTAIPGNISAISAGIAIYEKSMDAVYVTLIFAVMAVITSRSD